MHQRDKNPIKMQKLLKVISKISTKQLTHDVVLFCFVFFIVGSVKDYDICDTVY